MSLRNELPVIILATGRGNRLGNLTEDIPKAMLKVGDQTIIERQVFALKELNLKKYL